MAGLLEQAAADLAGILSDTVGGFAVPVTVIDPNNRKATINGLAADIGLVIDPETGVAATGRKVSIALPIANLRAAGLGVPIGVADQLQRPWVVKFTMPTGKEMTFKVDSTMPDKLGVVVCFLKVYEE